METANSLVGKKYSDIAFDPIDPETRIAPVRIRTIFSLAFRILYQISLARGATRKVLSIERTVGEGGWCQNDFVFPILGFNYRLRRGSYWIEIEFAFRSFRNFGFVRERTREGKSIASRGRDYLLIFAFRRCMLRLFSPNVSFRQTKYVRRPLPCVEGATATALFVSDGQGAAGRKGRREA